MTGDVYPLPSANGVCVLAIAEALAKDGHKIDIICNGTENKFEAHSENGITYHIVKSNYTAPYKYSLFERILRVISLRIILPLYPVKDLPRITYYKRMYKEINSVEKVDCLISCVMPFEAGLAGKKLKDENLLNCFMIYQLDSLGNNRFDEGDGLLQQYRRRKAKTAELTLFDSADAIFELKCNQFFYNSEQFQKIKSKIRFIDIPLVSEDLYLKIRSLERKTIKDQSVITFIYAGGLQKSFRDPSFIIQLIDKIQNERKVDCIFNFFTKANLSQFLDGVENVDIIRNRGYVSQDELNLQYSASDFLISIGNKSTSEIHEIPSKLFVYISTGKPIIHISGGAYDACLPYLSRYENAIIIDPDSSLEDNYENLKCFILEHRGKVIDFDEIVNRFIENTSFYTKELLIDALRMQHDLI